MIIKIYERFREEPEVVEFRGPLPSHYYIDRLFLTREEYDRLEQPEQIIVHLGVT